MDRDAACLVQSAHMNVGKSAPEGEDIGQSQIGAERSEPIKRREFEALVNRIHAQSAIRLIEPIDKFAHGQVDAEFVPRSREETGGCRTDLVAFQLNRAQLVVILVD